MISLFKILLYFYINNNEVIFLYNRIILQILIYHIKEHILQNIQIF